VPVDLIAEDVLGCPETILRGGDVVAEIAYDSEGRVMTWRSLVGGKPYLTHAYAYQGKRIVRESTVDRDGEVQTWRAVLIEETPGEILETPDDGDASMVRRYQVEEDGRVSRIGKGGLPESLVAWQGETLIAPGRTYVACP
jgi:hypothetical protein